MCRRQEVSANIVRLRKRSGERGYCTSQQAGILSNNIRRRDRKLLPKNDLGRPLGVFSCQCYRSVTVVCYGQVARGTKDREGTREQRQRTRNGPCAACRDIYTGGRRVVILHTYLDGIDSFMYLGLWAVRASHSTATLSSGGTCGLYGLRLMHRLNIFLSRSGPRAGRALIFAGSLS